MITAAGILQSGRGVPGHIAHFAKEKTMRNRILLAVLLAITAVSAGCNTIAGAGKDIERGGENIQKAAE